MDAIAAESGVSKATVYKHWANKDALLIEVIGASEKLPEFDSGNAKEDLRSFLRYLAQARKREELGRIWPRVIGYAISNPEFAKALRDSSFGPRRQRIARILEDGVAKGELATHVDSEFALDLLLGPIMHRRFMDPENAPMELADRVVNYFWEVFGKPRPRKKGGA